MIKEFTLQEKVDLILKTFKEQNAKIWIIDTNFVATYNRLHASIQPFKEEDINHLNIFLTGHNTKTNYYALKINGHLVYPFTRSKKVKQFTLNDIKYESWAESTIRQLVQEGEALGFFSIEDNFLKLRKIGQASFAFNSDFINFINSDFKTYMKERLMNIIFKSLKCSVSYVINLGYSLFIYFLLTSHINEKINLSKHEFIVKTNRKINNIYKGKFHDWKSLYINLVKDKSQFPNTYNEAVDYLKEMISIDKLIDYMFNVIKDRNFIYNLLTENEINQINSIDSITIANLKNQLSNARSRLRRNIIESRVHNLEYYNDLENTKPEEFCVRDCQACHIYNVQEIWKRILNNLNNSSMIHELINASSDSENGILMSNDFHDLFDKNVFTFDTMGNLHVNDFKNNSKRLKKVNINNYDDVRKIRIRKDILTPKMVEYLNHRNFNHKFNN